MYYYSLSCNSNESNRLDNILIPEMILDHLIDLLNVFSSLQTEKDMHLATRIAHLLQRVKTLIQE
jgi:hypothetical protein